MHSVYSTGYEPPLTLSSPDKCITAYYTKLRLPASTTGDYTVFALNAQRLELSVQSHYHNALGLRYLVLNTPLKF